ALCAGGCVAPFMWTRDVGSLGPKIRAFIHDPLQRGAFSDEGVSLLQHALFTMTLCVWLKELQVRAAATWAAVIGVVAAVTLEGSQLIIESRMPGVWDAAVGTAGAL